MKELANGPRTPDDIVAALYEGTVPPDVLPLARISALGTLEKLVRDGRAAVEKGDLFRRVAPILLVAALALALFAGGGCAASQFKDESGAARRMIDRAKDAGAPETYVADADRTFDDALAAERAAQRDIERGRDELTEAEERRDYAAKAKAARQTRLAQLSDESVAAERDLARARTREAMLRAKGLSEPEVRAADGGGVAAAQQRVEAVSAAKKAIEKQIELAEVYLRFADAAARAATARIDSGEQRLRLAQVLYRHAEQQARIAEIEALSRQRAAMDEKLARQP